MAVTVKELQDDHLVSIKISGFFYKRVKSMLFRQLNKLDPEIVKEFLNPQASEKSPEFYNSNPEAFDIQTLFILLSEIENASLEQKQFNEKEILEPGDEGYVEPTSEG